MKYYSSVSSKGDPIIDESSREERSSLDLAAGRPMRSLRYLKKQRVRSYLSISIHMTQSQTTFVSINVVRRDEDIFWSKQT
jgi:hypothetical protein